MLMTHLSRFSIFVLAYNFAVILWGAYVRASGSGAGCGDHWPLCNGVVLPKDPALKTVIEFSHRLSSGLSLMFVLALFVWVMRKFSENSLLKTATIGSLVFILLEALIGAGLVLLGHVGVDQSTGRMISISLHLVNTFLLLAALTSVCVITYFDLKEITLPRGWLRPFLLCFLVGITGAIAALGDTLFPSLSLSHGFAQDFSNTAHLALRLRSLHPFLAVLTALSLLLFSTRIPHVRFRKALFHGVLTQVAVGVLNLVLLAPVSLQLVHLLLADLVWVIFVAGILTPASAAPDHQSQLIL